MGSLLWAAHAKEVVGIALTLKGTPTTAMQPIHD
jgi:hypothetical protein